MILVYLVCFILLTCGIILLLDLTPETITDDLMRLFVPEQPLRDKVLIAQGRKKSRRITKIILHIREALEATGKSNQFTAACAASLFLMIAGCIAAVLIGNYFLIPVFAVAFAALPFFFARNTISAYDRHIREEMETALSIVTTSYIRTDDIVGAVRENIAYLKPPIREIFLGFVGDSIYPTKVNEAYSLLMQTICGELWQTFYPEDSEWYSLYESMPTTSGTFGTYYYDDRQVEMYCNDTCTRVTIQVSEEGYESPDEPRILTDEEIRFHTEQAKSQYCLELWGLK